MAAGLVERGGQVTVFSAAYAGAPRPTRRRRRSATCAAARSSPSTCSGMRGAAAPASSARVDAVVDVQNGLPFFTAPGHPQAGRRPRPPRAPRAVAGRLPRADAAGSAGGSSAGWRRGSTGRQPVRRGVARHPGGAARRSASTGPRIAVVHNGTDPAVPVGAGEVRAPEHLRGRPPGPAQAGRARDRRRPRAARGAPRPPAHRRRQRLVGGRAAPLRRRPRRRRHRRLHRSRRRAAQARDLRGVLGDGAAVAEGGVGPGRRRGRPTATPTVAYRSAGGTRESIVDGVSGLLVDSPDELTAALGGCCATPAYRQMLAKGALEASTGSPGSTRSRPSHTWWRPPSGASSSATRTQSRTAPRTGTVLVSCRHSGAGWRSATEPGRTG